MTLLRKLYYAITIPLLATLSLVILSIPKRTGEVLLHSKDYNPIHLYRDSFGATTIKAESMEEALYGLGFAHAQDRLWQLHLHRMLFSGRLSELFGERVLEFDKFMRTLSFSRYAKATAEVMNGTAKRYLDAYTKGINDYVSQSLFYPLEFVIIGAQWDKWTMEDCITLAMSMSFNLATDWQWQLAWDRLIEVLGPELTKEFFSTTTDKQIYPDSVILSDEDLKFAGLFEEYMGEFDNESEIYSSLNNQTDRKDFTQKKLDPFLTEMITGLATAASNAWVVHGNHTKSGKPILANDPHLNNAIPSLWVQTNIIVPDNFIHGITFPGLPTVLIGKTKYFSWGMTTFYGDTSDIYRENISPDNKAYYHDGKWLPLAAHVEKIIVKGWRNPVEHTVYETHHGPVLDKFIYQFSDAYTMASKKAGVRYSLAWTGYRAQKGGLDVFFDFLESKNTKEILDNLSKLVIPSQSLVFATTEGDIGFYVTGKIPKRLHQRQGAIVLDGTDSKYDWKGYVPFVEVPHVINPPKGYIIVANNKVATDNIKHRTSLNQWTTSRAKRIEEVMKDLLAKGEKIGVEDMKALQLDVVDPWARDFVPIMTKLVQDNYKNYPEFADDQHIPILLSALSDFDGKFDVESYKASIYAVWEREFTLQGFANYNWSEEEKMSFFNNILYDHFSYRKLREFSQGKSLSDLWCSNPSNAGKANPCVYNLIKALQNVYPILEKKFGSSMTAWRWGSLHKMVYRHTPFSDTILRRIYQREVEAPGNSRTVNVARYTVSKAFDGLYAGNLRMVVNMNDAEKSYYIIDTGNEESPFSKNYDNQLKLHSKGEYLEMRSGKSALEDTVKHMTLLFTQEEFLV